MAYSPLPRFLFRAPLLPVRAATGVRSRDALRKHPLGPAAIALGSPDLAAAKSGGARRNLALDRYRRRAAFRPTPAGLLAGVGVGSLGGRTRFRTGSPAAVYRLRWQRLAELGRALLDLPEVRSEVCLRRAPSVLMGAHTVIWLGGGRGDGAFIEERRADLDDVLVAVLEATAAWVPWTVARAAIPSADAAGADESELDELLGSMIDDGLLHTDLTPPLVGPPPASWLRARLQRIPAAHLYAERLGDAEAATARGDAPAAEAILNALPCGDGPVSGVDATLVFPRTAAAHASLDRAGVARAAALAPLLFRLQEALTPPAAERTAAPALADALYATTEIFGAGAVDLAAFARGDYGVDPAEDERDTDGGAGPPAAVPATAVAAGPDRALLTLLVDRIVAGARADAPEVAFHSADLAPLLPELAPPPTCELFVTPGRPRPRQRPGTGWLLGLHAPAGASWGRFAFALGDDANPLLADLRDAEARARPGEMALDVVWTPSDRLADICCHPPVRAAALAIGGWPAADQPALTVSDLDLVADPAALEPLGLRHAGRDPVAVAPVPLHRVRSTTAPPGVWRLLAGWSLFRQHAPWALNLGPLGELAFTPRISIDGFVVSPASWRVPALTSTGRLSPRAIAAWRREAHVPRVIQVGREDELLPVDLDGATAAADLTGARRVFEIWPAPGDTPDQSGRRLEVVVALADRPDDGAAAQITAAVTATRAAGPVGPARSAAPASERWCTFKLFGAADRQDQVLLGAVEPAARDAATAGEIADWFFLRYVDGPGHRPHLRLRVRVTDADRGAPHDGAPYDGAAYGAGGAAFSEVASGSAFGRRLLVHLGPAFAAGDVVAIERAPYFPEASRFGGAASMPAIHQVFAADSALACALLGLLAEPDDPLNLAEAPDARSALLVCGFDALARAFGLDAPARQALGARRREAHAASPKEAALRQAEHGRLFRTMGGRLRQLLGAPPPPLGDAVARFEEGARAAARALDPERRTQVVPAVLPALLHLSAVRLAGLDREAEILAYGLWERTLGSLAHHPQRTSARHENEGPSGFRDP